jgi:site-specific DNA-methyltransferase (cytosine-N4-specific)
MLTIFTTNNGLMLWANCEDAVGLIDEGSVSLLLSSPPYPILRQKAYQRGDDHSTQAWTEWMLRLCEQWAKMLTPTGSMMLNLGTVWEPGMPAQSLYIERLLIRLQDALGFHLLQRLDWHSPSKLPSPAEWVTIRKLRVKPSVEPILWLSQNPFAHGDNRNVLVPYSKSSLRALANPKTGVQTRPSGHTFGAGMFVDNGGAIPPSLISASNTASASKYRAAERAAGRKSHPAMMPDALAEFGIKLATQLDDLVYDPFSGAGTVALAAEKLGRRWIGTERSREYITSSGINFTANGISINNLIAA